MKAHPPALPLEPLLDIYQRAGLATGAELAELPVLGPRFQAILTAPRQLLDADFLDHASAEQFQDALANFYEYCVFPPLHTDTVRRRAGFLRHALMHLRHSAEPLTQKAAHYLDPCGTYHVAGLGPMFWSALFQGIDPLHQPGGLRGVTRGLARLGLLPGGTTSDVAVDFNKHQAIYRKVLTDQPKMSALHLDYFLCVVAGMQGRELWSGVDLLKATVNGADFEGLIRAERSRLPLRRRLKDQGRARERQADFPWQESLRGSWMLLDDLAGDVEPVGERDALFGEALQALCRIHRLHQLEVPDVLAALVREQSDGPRTSCESTAFQGFCQDTFRFLEELEKNNNRGWMARSRERYQFVLRQPLTELAEALADRYVRPILNGRWELNLETVPRTGKVLSSIGKNDYGRSVPYQTALWLTFCRRKQFKKKDAQFFVRVDDTGVGFGLRLGRDVREAGKQFRRQVQEQADLVFDALGRSGALAHCVFAGSDDWIQAGPIASAADLRAWAAGKILVAGCHIPADSALLRGEELVGEILLCFERLLPAYLCAVLADPRPALERQADTAAACFTTSDFARQTHLTPAWLERARTLLALKRQLILQGVPGTGKTFVARSLARWLTCARPEAVRLVQFHPAYSYEEFVEGIKPRSVESNGRHDITYPVEDGVLGAFAARAARAPGQPFVLIIDEINRGNLPRIFGDLLYLLEYRGHSLVLPYSRREFRLPPNLYLIATMNAADRSVTALDQALRRRFSFLDMAPDPRLLAAWLDAHPPAAGRHFAIVVVELFEQLNRQLQSDLGPAFQVGHSYFMLPDLDEEKLHVIWQHQVRPLVEEYCAGQPGRAEAYQIDLLLQSHWRERSGRKPAAAR